MSITIFCNDYYVAISALLIESQIGDERLKICFGALGKNYSYTREQHLFQKHVSVLPLLLYRLYLHSCLADLNFTQQSELTTSLRSFVY